MMSVPTFFRISLNRSGVVHGGKNLVYGRAASSVGRFGFIMMGHLLLLTPPTFPSSSAVLSGFIMRGPRCGPLRGTRGGVLFKLPFDFADYFREGCRIECKLGHWNGGQDYLLKSGTFLARHDANNLSNLFPNIIANAHLRNLCEDF